MGIGEIAGGAGLLGIVLWLINQFVNRGTSSNVKEKAEELAAKRREVKGLRNRDEISELEYERDMQSLEADEERLKQEVKDADDIKVPDSTVDDLNANELARRLSEYTD